MASTVATAVAARTYRTGSGPGVASMYAYVDGLEQHAYHWYFSPDAATGLIPTNDGFGCVFAAMRPDRFERVARSDVPGAWWRTLRDVSPDLAGEVAAAKAVTRHRSFPGRRAHFRQSFGPGWALVGDAGHYNDPATAHGITGALRDAELLARAVTTGELRSYQAVRDELANDVFEVTDRIASFDWDLDSLALAHRELSRALAAESETVAAWATHPTVSFSGSASRPHASADVLT
jgi:2-polyprenyl-6-methoxyphenol hydroxylase-like FAD-dependent oxidoreductase